jgi:hypothetical protein
VITVRGVRRTRALLVAVVAGGLTVAAAVMPVSSSATAASALLYDYEFAGTTGTVANSAPSGPVVPLTLTGDWSVVPDGVHFAGDTKGDSSVAHGAPASGYTLNAAATATVGFGTRFVYSAPATGLCFGDTPNVTQVGRFAARTAQAKLQLSKCADDKTGVIVECRFAGSLTPSTVLPVRSSLALVNGHAYNATCTKSPDVKTKATVTLSVTDLSTGTTPTPTTNAFSVAAVGAMKSTQAISAGNKYPLPTPAKNTDQFVGDITRAVYCTGSSADVAACLTANLPLG